MTVQLQAPLKTALSAMDALPPLLPLEKGLWMRAIASPEISVLAKNGGWLFEQSFAPYALALSDMGIAVSPFQDCGISTMDRIVYLATRSSEENAAEIARAWDMLKPGGWLVTAQHNDHGAKRLETLLKQLASEISSTSKHHARAVMAQKPKDYKRSPAEDVLLKEWRARMVPHPIAGSQLQAAPGMFSWKSIDAGSQLLAEQLPTSLQENGADIGAGWGYLSWAILARCPKVKAITLYEAEKRALDMAEINLQSRNTSTTLTYQWADATRPLVKQTPFDWAVMNPPVHDMMVSAPDATQAMFATAHGALRQSGSLWIVANQHLPYERSLQKLFSHVSIITEERGYKIIEARK